MYLEKTMLAPSKGFAAVASIIGLFGSFAAPAAALDDSLAFNDRFNFRIASYSVQDADTDILVADSDTGIGVAYSFRDDFGGEDSVTVPRLDLGYRFNDRHRLDFAYFDIDRSGRQVLRLDVDLDDQSYSIGDTLVSDIDYEVLRFAYGYSFYRTDRVELGFNAGLHFTTYQFEYELADGTQDDSVEATGPLPMFGFRLSYAMTPTWSLHYLAEAFYINIDDTYEGSFTTSEVDVEYRFNKYFTLGAGISRFAIDLEADDSDWKGSIVDSHRGMLAYATFYL